MNELIILLLIVILCYQSIVNSINSRCMNNKDLFIPIMQGVKMSQKKEIYNILPTITVAITESVPCGVYLAETQYGIVTLFVGYSNRNISNIYFHKFSREINKETIFTFFNVKRIINNNDVIISTFNSGCCGES